MNKANDSNEFRTEYRQYGVILDSNPLLRFLGIVLNFSGGLETGIGKLDISRHAHDLETAGSNPAPCICG